MFDRYKKELLSVDRNGIDSLTEFIETTKFSISPASVEYNNPFEGGLVQHCLEVMDRAFKLDIVSESYKESIIICSLLHDLYKADLYSVDTRNVKVDGVWTAEEYYKFDKYIPNLFHTMKSVIIVQNFIQLTPDEVNAIWLMGNSDTQYNQSIHSIRRSSPLAVTMESAHNIEVSLND